MHNHINADQNCHMYARMRANVPTLIQQYTPEGDLGNAGGPDGVAFLHTAVLVHAHLNKKGTVFHCIYHPVSEALAVFFFFFLRSLSLSLLPPPPIPPRASQFLAPCRSETLRGKPWP